MRLTDHDASFLYTETASGPMHTAGVIVLDGVVPFEKIYHHFESRLHLVPRFRQRLAFVPMNLAHPRWVDDPEFKLENHILHHKLPDGTSMEAAVEAILEINEDLLDRERPVWRFIVVEGVPDRTLILQQIHHAMIDGASAVQIQMVIYDFERDAPDPPPPSEPWNPAPLPTAFELITEAMRENAEQAMRSNPLQALEGDAQSRELMQRGMTAISRFFTRPAITAPWNAGTVGPKRELRWTIHDFGEFREIRRVFGGTINDVVLAAVTEGAARYLEDHGEQTANQHLRLMCPVNVRTENDTGDLGNRVSGIFPMVPAYTVGAVERMRLVCEETGRIKAAQEAQALSLMQASTVSVPPVAMAPTLLVGTSFDPTVFAARNPPPVLPRMGARPPYYGFNFTCTNVPGVQVPQYLAGSEVLFNFGMLMLGGSLGYGVAVGSYNQKMIFNFICEPRLMPDLDKMVNEVEQVFGELLSAAREQNASAA